MNQFQLKKNLRLVRGMVEEHGGTIEVKSNLEEGTTFIVKLPMDARPFF